MKERQSVEVPTAKLKIFWSNLLEKHQNFKWS